MKSATIPEVTPYWTFQLAGKNFDIAVLPHNRHLLKNPVKKMKMSESLCDEVLASLLMCDVGPEFLIPLSPKRSRGELNLRICGWYAKEQGISRQEALCRIFPEDAEEIAAITSGSAHQ